MDEIKENLVSRKSWYGGICEYGVMLAQNECEVHNFDDGFDHQYIEKMSF